MAKVLVIEDDLQTATEITEALGDYGFDVECAHDGREGLLKAAGEKYDAIVLDRMLPGDLDGLGVLATLRTIGSETPVLILSALSAVDERVRGLRAGGDDYLTKPFEFVELTARIEVLARRRAVAGDEFAGRRSGDRSVDPPGAPRRPDDRAPAARIPPARISDAARRAGRHADHAVRGGLGLSLRPADECDRRPHRQAAPEARRRRAVTDDPHRPRVGLCPPS